MNSLYNIFESIYKESLIKLKEINIDNFWTKINNNINGSTYAKSFLCLDPTGLNTPIHLLNTLPNERYIFNNELVKGFVHLTSDGAYNSFIIEKLYEELLLKVGKKMQDKLKKFFTEFVNELKQNNVIFINLNFIDYDTLVA